MPFERSLHHSSKSRLQQGIIQAEWSWHKKEKQTLPRYPTARFHKHLACDPRASKEHSQDLGKRSVFFFTESRRGEGKSGRLSETDLPADEASGVRCPALPRGPAASRPHRRRARRRMLRPVEEEHASTGSSLLRVENRSDSTSWSRRRIFFNNRSECRPNKWPANLFSGSGVQA